MTEGPQLLNSRWHDVPRELIHQILDDVDPQTAFNYSIASRKARGQVLSHPAYHDLTTHAPQVLVALANAELLGRFPLFKLHSALKSPDCISCGEFGGLLFLPICRRICQQCVDFSRDAQISRAGDGWVTGSSGSASSLPYQVPRFITAAKAEDSLFMLGGTRPSSPRFILGRALTLRSISGYDLGYSARPQAWSTVPMVYLRADHSVEVGVRCEGCRITRFAWRHGLLSEEVREAIEAPMRPKFWSPFCWNMSRDYKFLIHEIYLWKESLLGAVDEGCTNLCR